MIKSLKGRAELRIAFFYAVIGGLWILLTDFLLGSLIPDYLLYTRYQTYKGWFFVTASALLIYYLIKREIAKRKRTTEKLRASEETLRRYELLSEHSRDIILFMRQDDGRILEANAAAAQAYGYSREELLELTIHHLRAQNTRDLTKNQMVRANDAGILFETAHLRKDGSTFPVEVSSQGATVGGVRTLVSIIRDITERRRAEAEIASLSKFPTENPNPVIRVYPDGQLTYANAASRELLEMWSCKVNDFLPPEWKDLIGETVKAGSDRTLDVPCNGKVYSIMVVPVSDGSYVNLYGRDITARIRAEQALFESEEKYRLIADNANDWIYWINTDGNFRYVSPSCEHITGFTHLEFMNNPRLFIEIVHPEDRALVDRHTEQALDEAAAESLEYRIVNKSGEVRWMSHSCAPLYSVDGKYIGRRATNRDITERIRAEVSLRKRNLEIRSLYESMTELIVLHEIEYDADGKAINYRILEFNPAFEKLIGISQSKAAGALATEIYGTEEAPYLDIYARVAESGEPIEFETEFAPLGKHFHISVFSPEKGQFATLTSDITDRKHAEGELRRTMEELKASNAELEQFAYVTSHDLQEPLRGIAGIAQLLQQRYQGQLDSQADEFLYHIFDGTQRMQTLINDLLAYSRIGRRGEAIRHTSVEAALKAAIQNLNVAIREYGATITNDSLPTVKADTTQLIQLFQNLIGNAIKFRAERSPEIHIGVNDTGDCWQIFVRDNGIGIEPQYFERIFQVFQRLHTRREYKGTGIGLAICKKIIERHGGKIWVESDFGIGSTFYFTLPKGD